jgi:hypothetical protein
MSDSDQKKKKKKRPSSSKNKPNSERDTQRRPSPGEADYGRPRKGSLTEKRGQDAQDWAHAEVQRVVAVIKRTGHEDLETAQDEVLAGLAEMGGLDSEDSDSGRVISFGALFRHYEKISDTVMGSLRRAKGLLNTYLTLPCI